MGDVRLHRLRRTLRIALCIFVAAASACSFAVYLAKPQTGLVVNFPETVMENGQVLYAPKTPFSPAAEGGLLPGRDAILSVNGMEIRNTRDLIRADAALWSFQPFPVRVLRDGAEIRTVVLTPVFAMYRVDWILILFLAASLGFTAFALTAWASEERGTEFVVLACLTYLAFTCVKPFYYVSFLANAVIQGGRFTAWLLVLFASRYPVPRGGSRPRTVLAAVILALLLLFTAVRLWLYIRWDATGLEVWLDRYRALGKAGNVSDALAYLCFAALLVSSRLRSKTGEAKKGIEWILAGLLLAIPPYFFLDQLPIILGQSLQMRVSLGNLSGLFLAILPLFIVIGVLGRRVLDVRYLAVRYLVYGILLAVVFWFFTRLAPPLRRLLSAWYSMTPALAETLSASILFVLLMPLRAFLIRLADRFFWRDAYRRSPAYVRDMERRNEQLALLLDRGGRESLQAAGRRLLDDLGGILHGLFLRMRDPRDAAGAMRKLSALMDGDPHGAPKTERCRALLETAAAGIHRDHPRAVVLSEGDGDPAVLCRAGEVTVALARVMENAVEACDGGAEVVGARFRERGGTVEIEIGDRGGGFDPRMRQRAFRPFTTSKQGHEGLGLFLARVFAEANGGAVEILPPSEGGARILFRFPAVGGRAGA
jgi:signal transduction histidine kinase